MNTSDQTGKRALGIWMSTALVVGNMIGSGVYLLPASLAAYGSVSLLGWVLTSAGALLLALTFSRLGRMIPRTGGPYVYTHEAFGNLPGFLVGWGHWISTLAGNAAIAVAFVGYLGVFVPGLAEVPLAAAVGALSVIWLLTVVNVWGVREAGAVQLVTTVLKLLPLIVVAIVGMLHIHPQDFRPFVAGDGSIMSALSASATLTLWAYLGLESATVAAGNVRDPERTIPRATTFGTILTAVVYIAGTAGVMALIPAGNLVSSTAPFADAARSAFGQAGAYAVAAGATISCFGALNGWILLSGQIPYAMARDGLFPAGFARLSSRRTPTFGLVFSSMLVTVFIGLNYTRGLVDLFTFIVLLATLTGLLPYAFSSMAEMMLYIQDPERPGARNIGRSVAVAGFAFLYSMWAIGGSGAETVYWGFLLIVGGIPVFVWNRWKREGSSQPGRKG